MANGLIVFRFGCESLCPQEQRHVCRNDVHRIVLQRVRVLREQVALEPCQVPLQGDVPIHAHAIPRVLSVTKRKFSPNMLDGNGELVDFRAVVLGLRGSRSGEQRSCGSFVVWGGWSCVASRLILFTRVRGSGAG